MEGHERNLYLYDRFNARVVGVSRDDVLTLKYWGNGLGITFPLLSNIIEGMDAFYESLLVRAATIDELLSDDFEALPGQKGDADLSAQRLAACGRCLIA